MGWALHLGCSPELIGILGALPFASQLIQLPSAWLSCVAGYRRVAIVTVAGFALMAASSPALCGGGSSTGWVRARS
jgi:hypothetical protein